MRTALWTMSTRLPSPSRPAHRVRGRGSDFHLDCSPSSHQGPSCLLHFRLGPALKASEEKNPCATVRMGVEYDIDI